jgi:hypothetical protein
MRVKEPLEEYIEETGEQRRDGVENKKKGVVVIKLTLKDSSHLCCSGGKIRVTTQKIII